MGIRQGMEAVLYRNSGTFAVPVLSPLTNAKDVTLNLSVGTANVTVRGSGGWNKMAPTQKDLSVDFTLLADSTDANFIAIKNAFFATTLSARTIEFFIMSADVDESDSDGVRCDCMIEKFTRNEPLEDYQTYDVTIRPTASANNPQYVSGSTYASYD